MSWFGSDASWKVVVCRHNEDPSWLRMFRGEEVEILNKGEALPWTGVGWTVTQLPNVGRETQAFLWWIVENYDRLPDVVCFLQGKATDHLGPKWTPFSRKGEEIARLLHHSGENWLEVMVRYFLYRCRGADNADWICDIRQADGLGANLTDGRILAWGGPMVPANMTMWDYFKGWVDVEDVIDKEQFDRGYVYWNSIFSVRKERILLRPREYYLSLLYSPTHHDHNNVEMIHFIERSWYYIFGCHLPLNKAKALL